jgi:hypothetical protein
MIKKALIRALGCATAWAAVIAPAKIAAAATQLAQLPFADYHGRIATDGVNVYIGDYGCSTGNIWSVPVSGGSPVAVASGLCFPQNVGYAASTVFIGADPLGFVSTSGGAVTTLGAGDDWDMAPDIDGSRIYYSNFVGGTFVFYGVQATSGATSTQLFADNGYTSGVDVDGQFVYVASYTNGTGGTAAIRKIGKQGGSLTTLSTDVAQPTGLRVAANSVFWANAGVTAGNGQGSIKRVNTGGGTTVTLYQGGNPDDIVTDGQCVYWTDPTAHQILAVPQAGGASSVVYQDPSGFDPSNITLDTSNLYFTLHDVNGNQWTVQKLPKGCTGVTSLSCVPISGTASVALYTTAGTITPVDSVTTFTVPPATGGTGSVSIDTRTLTATTSVPATGERGYQYRTDLTQAQSGSGNPCIESLTVPFGMAPIRHDFNGDGVLDDCYVITSGGIGSVAPSNVAISGGTITIGYGAGVCAGQGSFPVGFLGPAGPNVPTVVVGSAIDNASNNNAVQVRVPSPARAPASPALGIALLAMTLAGVGLRGVQDRSHGGWAYKALRRARGMLSSRGEA